MPTLGRFRRELRGRRFWSVPVEREVDSELAFHLEMRVRELVEQGMTPDDARAAALTRFGDVDRITEACQNLTPATGSFIPARLVYGTDERRANPNIPSPSQQPRRNQDDPPTAASTDGAKCLGTAQ